MTDPIRVSFFHIDGDLIGGGGNMLLRLLEDLDKNSVESTLIVQEPGETYLRAQELDVQTRIVPFGGILDTYGGKLLSTNFFGKVRSMGRILQYNAAVRPVIRDTDVIWCKNLRMVLTLLPWTRLSSKPFIWNIGLGLKSHGLVKQLHSIALRSVDHVFIESETQARRMFTEEQFHDHRSKFAVFHKGVDTERFDPDLIDKPADGSGFTIGTAASITPRKGLADLIDAMPQILKSHRDVRLQIAGEPPNGHTEYLHSLKEKIVEHDIEEFVNFLGWVEEMPEYLASLDVFVLPSHNEGVPGAVREALAMEVPVVATDVGGTSEVVNDTETGFLIEPRDPDAIVEAIDYLLANPNARGEMGTRGRELIINEFSIESYVSNYEAFLTETVGE